MKNLLSILIILISFTSLSNDGWPSKKARHSNAGFNYKKLHKKHKKVKRHNILFNANNCKNTKYK